MTVAAVSSPLTSVELAAVRADFPLLSRQVGGKDLIYLDSAATSQKPECVVDAISDFYLGHNAAVHRGAHQLGDEATEAYEAAREQVARLIGAGGNEVVFTKNATEALNMVALSFLPNPGSAGDASKAWPSLGPGDEIVVTETEHHANLVPWQQLASRTGAALKYLHVDDDGRILLEDLSIINDRTAVVAFTYVSNVTGVITPAAQIIEAAHAHDALAVVDICQAVPHIPVDVVALDADFAAFSAHKMLGPTGVGALYGKSELLQQMPPVYTGGSMVETVTMTEATFAPAPARFEPGTPMIAQAVGFGVAAEYLAELGMERVHLREQELTEYLLNALATVDGVRVLGPTTATERVGAVSFEVSGVHPHDVAQLLSDDGIAVRSGHHCAQPIHARLGALVSTRASLAIYNTYSEIDAFIHSLSRVRGFFGR